MMGHEHVGMQRTAGFTKRLAKLVEISAIVVFTKTGFAVMAALHDMQRYVIQMNACSTKREPIVAEEYSTWPL